MIVTVQCSKHFETFSVVHGALVFEEELEGPILNCNPQLTLPISASLRVSVVSNELPIRTLGRKFRMAEIILQDAREVQEGFSVSDGRQLEGLHLTQHRNGRWRRSNVDDHRFIIQPTLSQTGSRNLHTRKTGKKSRRACTRSQTRNGYCRPWIETRGGNCGARDRYRRSSRSQRNPRREARNRDGDAGRVIDRSRRPGGHSQIG